ncbi:extracellular catalytic domain type 1 short-chain-length polyhydroxyalkanoate depolymerase [Streptomyces triticisoli]|jgi:poly(hydroxyalkanoate) depolymerase family esterase|uniref:extracellular catalytic domain type 1 short-chain-length polyhydroxyalkanoate depolymerase n=1 Tax=Streptomyces triticisoli TaxID=2182797 RepID=UPI001E44412A|nr:PHB depolymerase family esterase [Streptomyces triticisoli]
MSKDGDMIRRRPGFRLLLTALLTGVAPLLAALLLAAPGARAASLTEVTGFGANPSNLRMYVYRPDSAPARPAVLVAVHYCTGSGPAFHSGTEFASLADRYGFLVVYPSVTRDGGCFDVSSPQALRRGGGSDPVGIMSMVTYAQQHYGADPARVFVTGASSGAMMTNVLLGDYPDVFKAGAAFMGVPFGCFATTDGSSWNSACANGTVTRTPQQWGDLVRAAHPGYSGPRPRMQLWHGTEDTILRHPNLGEEIKQWTDVLGVSQAPAFTDHPQSTWTRTRYGGTGTQAPVEAVSIQGTGHTLPTAGMAARAIAFFGLDTTTTPPPTDPPPPAPAGACRVTYTTSAWNTGLTASITLTNTGTAPVDGWTLGFTLPAGQTITSGWNAAFSPTSGAVTARNVAYNATLGPGASTTLGFQATHTGNTGTPSSFTLNGTACQRG